MAVVVDFEDEVPFIIDVYKNVKKDIEFIKSIPIVIDQVDFMDEIVETSTLVPGCAEDPPDHDLFVVVENFTHTMGAMDAVRDCLLSLGDLGKVVDFGAGMVKRYCDCMQVVEHVEWRESRSQCTCGCGITPYATPFYTHKILDTFVAINSLQNNSHSFVQRMLNQIYLYELDFVIIQPVKLNHDEIDCEHLIMSRFIGVRRFLIGNGSMIVFHYNRKVVMENVHIVSQSVSEVCVTNAGEPTPRDSQEIKQSILIFGMTEENHVLVVDSGDGGPCDFLVAGHISYGEVPLDAAVREWREEMVSIAPKLEYYGMLHPPISCAKAYVFVAFVEEKRMTCAPSRGRVRQLRQDDKCRHDFYPALRALDRYFKMNQNFDLDSFCMRHYDSVVSSQKQKYLNKYKDNLRYKTIEKNLGKEQMYNTIFREHKSEMNKMCRVAAEDLRTKFSISLRPTNQSALVHKQLQVGEMVILNSDSLTPCPLINLVFEGRKVGYAVYVRTFQQRSIYRVQEMKVDAYQLNKDRNFVNYDLFRACISDKYAPQYVFNIIDRETASRVTFDDSFKGKDIGQHDDVYDRCVRSVSVPISKLREKFPVEFTDSELGAILLARRKNITYDEAVCLIRSTGYYVAGSVDQVFPDVV